MGATQAFDDKLTEKNKGIERLGVLFAESERMKSDDEFQRRISIAGSPEHRAMVELNVEIFKLRCNLKYKHGYLSPLFKNHWTI